MLHLARAREEYLLALLITRARERERGGKKRGREMRIRLHEMLFDGSRYVRSGPRFVTPRRARSILARSAERNGGEKKGRGGGEEGLRNAREDTHGYMPV